MFRSIIVSIAMVLLLCNYTASPVHYRGNTIGADEDTINDDRSFFSLVYGAYGGSGTDPDIAKLEELQRQEQQLVPEVNIIAANFHKSTNNQEKWELYNRHMAKRKELEAIQQKISDIAQKHS